MDATTKLRTALAGTGLLVGVGGLAALPSALTGGWGLVFVLAAFSACGALFAAAVLPIRRRVLLAALTLLVLGASALAFFVLGRAHLVFLAIGLAAAGAAVGPLLLALRMRRR